jgi:signal transduction histidine kinase/integral membrane sensor domain MASE1
MLSDTPPLADPAVYADLASPAQRRAGRWGRFGLSASVLAVAAGYWLTGCVALRLPFPGTRISALWLPNSLLLAALLLARRRDWWIYLLACLPAQLALEQVSADTTITRALIHYAVNCATALIGAFTLAAVVPGLRRVDRVRTGVALVLIGGVLAPLSTSVLLSVSLVLLDHNPTFWLTTIARTLTNSFATLTVVPLVLHTAAWVRSSDHSVAPARAAEGSLLAISLLTLGVLAFIAPQVVSEHSAALLYAPFAVLLWAGVRFGVSGSCASVLTLGILAIVGLLNQTGPFVAPGPYQSAISLLLFLVLTSMTMLLLCSALEERSALERTDAASRVRFRTIFERNIMPTLIWRADGSIVDANTSFFELTGYQRGDLTGGQLLTQRLLIPTSGLLTRPDPFILDGAPGPVECDLVARNGVRIPVLTQGSRFPGSSGEGTAYVLDLSSLRRAESERRQAQLLHSAVLASIHDQVAVLDHSGTIIETNQSWRRLGDQVDLPEFERAGVGAHYLEICDAAAGADATAGELRDAVCDVLAGRALRRRIEYSRGTAAGALAWHEIWVERLNRAEGGAVIRRADVTAHKLAMSEAREQRQQLAHLGRAAILGELSGAFAHELAQPLTSILGNAEAALQLLPLGGNIPEIQEILRDIIRDDVRAAEVIGRLRSMLAHGEIRREPVDLNLVVREVLALARGDLATRNVAVTMQLNPAPALVQGDHVQLQQVVLNLILNACEAMAETPIADRQLSVGICRDADGGLECAVIDRGRGIAPDQLERIFQPFVTTKKQGLGLGLAICRSIIEAQGGRLWAENAPERGAIFRFAFRSGL